MSQLRSNIVSSNQEMLAAERCWGRPDNRVFAWKRQIFMALCRTCRFPWRPSELNIKPMCTMVDITPWLNSVKKKIKWHLHVKTSKTSMYRSIIGSVKTQCYPRKFCYSKNHILGVYICYFMLIFCIKYIQLESKVHIYFPTADLANHV